MAKKRKVSLGTIVSALLRRALENPVMYLVPADFPVFKVRKNAAAFGIDEVNAALEEF